MGISWEVCIETVFRDMRYLRSWGYLLTLANILFMISHCILERCQRSGGLLRLIARVLCPSMDSGCEFQEHQRHLVVHFSMSPMSARNKNVLHGSLSNAD